MALALICAAATVLRFARLASPGAIVFDERYYARDACWYVETSKRVCGVATEQTDVHPPLGKWLISVGIETFGYDAFGWRVAAAVAGVAAVALTFALASRLFASVVAAALPAGLLAIDPLHFVQSRVAMLDVFVGVFTLATFLFVALDRDRILGGRKAARSRAWRWAAGAAAGLAIASKWSGLFALAGAVALTLMWETAARRRKGERRPVRRAIVKEGGSLVLAFVVVPLVVYLLTYAGRVDGEILAAPWSDGSWWRTWWERQVDMWEASRGLASSHPYESPAWSWPLLKRAISYYFETPGGEYAEILALGNPFVWWTSMAALAVVLVGWLRARTMGGTEAFIVIAVAFMYFPWLLVTGDRSAVFMYYMVPVLPFLFLAPGYVAAAIGRSWEAKAAVALYATGAIVTFAFYYPVLANVAIPKEQWRARIWIFDNCEVPEGRPTTSKVTRVDGGATRVRTSVSRRGADEPPDGWCWI